MLQVVSARAALRQPFIFVLWGEVLVRCGARFSSFLGDSKKRENVAVVSVASRGKKSALRLSWHYADTRPKPLFMGF